jgi:hypothetical protein
MNVHELLDRQKEDIVHEALLALGRCHLAHYEAEGEAVARERLRRLFDLTRETMLSRNAEAMTRYATEVAEERFTSGFDLLEVQTAFNVLEEAIWTRVLKGMEPRDFAESIGLVGTVLGLGKDALARKYVSLATQIKAPSIDYKALFKGTV